MLWTILEHFWRDGFLCNLPQPREMQARVSAVLRALPDGAPEPDEQQQLGTLVLHRHGLQAGGPIQFGVEKKSGECSMQVSMNSRFRPVRALRAMH